MRVPVDHLADNRKLSFVDAGINELGFITEQPLNVEIGRFVAIWRNQPGQKKDSVEKVLNFGSCTQTTVEAV